MGAIPFTSLCFILNILVVRGQTYTSTIQTASGPVRGLITSTVDKFTYAAFRGIPYAKPPTSTLRFKPPVQVDSWTSVYDATSDRSMCTQFNARANIAEGSEDCLYISVFTPHTIFNKSVSKPVMVYIYGGTFIEGNSNSTYYGPDFIVAQDVIMVSFNYRVSALGFLNLQHEKATGNAGLKDQNLALKWVKKNIASFGGDPNKVTIFGQSAGSVSVDLHVLSDMSTGLFSQSISMSGSPLCLFWGFQSRAEALIQGFSLGTKLGTTTTNKDTLLSALYKASATEIVTAANKILGIPFRPSIESTAVATNEEKFLTECTLNKYLNGDYTKGPHMLGFVANETISFTGSLDNLLEFVKEALDSIKNSTSKIPFLSDLTSAINSGVSSLLKNSLHTVIQETTDLFMILGIDTKQRLLSRNNKNPIYYYRFTFNSDYSAHKTDGINLDGVGHSDDIPYLLYMPTKALPLDQPDITATRQKMVKLWTNFAKYGNPTPDGTKDNVLKVTWPDSRSSGAHLDIGSDLTIGSRPTDASVTTLQVAGLGTSVVFNDCNNGVISNIINTLVGIIGIIG